MKENLIRVAIVVGAAVAYFVASKLDDPSAADALKVAAGTLLGLLFPQLATKKTGGGIGGQGGGGNSGARDHIVFPPLQSEPPASESSSVNRLRFAAVLTALVVALPSCSAMREVVWPTVVRCSSPPDEIVSDVMVILTQDGGGSLTDRAVEALEQLAATHGASLVTCAVNELANRLVGADGEQAAVAAKAEQWLELKGMRVEESPAGAAPCSE